MLLLVGLAISCRQFAGNASDSNAELPSQGLNATPTPYKAPTKVEIGMSYTEMAKLCQDPAKGERNSEDHISTFKSAKGEGAVVYLDYTKERSDRDCYGTLTFINGRLDSIAHY